MTRTPFPLLLALGFSPAAHAQAPKTEPPGPADAGAAAYQKVLPATVWIHSDRGGGRTATGSGSVVDRGRRLVLTNYHVVGNVKDATVFFPVFDGNKKAIPEKSYYTSRAARLGVPGQVVELDKDADLALIQLDHLPDGVASLAPAAASPDPGQTVHSIGNPGKSGALWVYTPGKVRQVYSKKWQAKLDERTTIGFQAKVIETDSPTNPGDSGGPLVNDRGELVGVTQGGAVDAQALSLFVDLSEVKKLLARRSVQALRTSEPTGAQPKDPPKKDPPKPAREAALKSKDEAKFFSEGAWKQVQPAAERLLKEKGIDLLIETLAAPPKDAPKLVTAEERGKYFKEYSEARAKAENVSGIYVVICKNPSFLYVTGNGPGAGTFPPGTGSKLTTALLTAFKDKKYDAGLTDVVQMTLDLQGLGVKKDDKKEEKK